MTVRELITKLDLIILQDPTIADLEVDADGCDCIEPAVDVREHGMDPSGRRARRVLIARQAA